MTATPEFWGNPIPPVTVSCPWKPYKVLQAVAGVSQYSGKIQLPDFKAVGSGFISSFKNRRSQTDVRKGEHCNHGGIAHMSSDSGWLPPSCLPLKQSACILWGCVHAWMWERLTFSSQVLFVFEKIDVALEIMFKNSGARWGKGYLLLHSKDVCEYTDFTLCIPFSAVVFKECYCRFSSTSVSVLRVCDPLCLSLSEAWHRILT